MKITLARALKIKKVLAGKLAESIRELHTYNSVAKGTERPDVRELEKRVLDLTEHMVFLKSALLRANCTVGGGIADTLFRLAETKSLLQAYKSLNTRNGDAGEMHYGTAVKIEYDAVIRREEATSKVAEYESAIEQMQEQVDQFNYNHSIELPDALFVALGIRR